MIVITGAAGFIGSCLVSKLNQDRFYELILVDDFTKTQKENNLKGKVYREKIDRMAFFDWLAHHGNQVEFIFHLGARTDTTEFDTAIFDELNLNYSKRIWEKCCEFAIPLVYASSAATYGGGEFGYDDSHDIVSQLKPLNPYGDSKNDFDKWALAQAQQPMFWAGLKFFNVYGPNEYHKGRMASVVYHAFNQIKANGEMKLFRSHNPNFTDGGQLRDFVYVKDVVSVCLFLMHHRKNSGLYNLGTGKAQTFLELVKAVFANLGQAERIDFVDTPADIRDKYQYFTQANMAKLRSIGFEKPFCDLEAGVADYLNHYLKQGNYY